MGDGGNLLHPPLTLMRGVYRGERRLHQQTDTVGHLGDIGVLVDLDMHEVVDDHDMALLDRLQLALTEKPLKLTFNGEASRRRETVILLASPLHPH